MSAALQSSIKFRRALLKSKIIVYRISNRVLQRNEKALLRSGGLSGSADLNLLGCRFDLEFVNHVFGIGCKRNLVAHFQLSALYALLSAHKVGFCAVGLVLCVGAY